MTRTPLGAVVVLAGATSAAVERTVSLIATLAERFLIVAVDGGAIACRLCGLRPDLVVGDGDSLRRPPRGVARVRYARDKDFSDFAGALAESRRRRVRVVAVAGLLGGRVDHEWANLFELGRTAPWFRILLAPTARGLVVVTSHGFRMATVPRRTVSAFALGGPARVSLAGTRFTLRNERLDPGSRGLSNVTGTELAVEVHSGAIAVVLPVAGAARIELAR